MKRTPFFFLSSSLLYKAVIFLMKFCTIAATLVYLTSTFAKCNLKCNGHKELCTRPYNKVGFACTHNSYSYEPPKTDFPVLNQERSIPQQLQDGVRAFMLDLVKPDPVLSIWDRIKQWYEIHVLHQKSDDSAPIHLCHTTCEFIDQGPLVDMLRVYRKFLDDNPREIITFIIENTSNFDAAQVQKPFKDSGLDKYAFVPPFKQHKASEQGYPWPTLEQLIAKGQRLVVFMDDHADTQKVPYILPEWDYVIETPYANVNPVSKFPCNQDRPRDHKPRDLLVLNHFAYNRLTIGKENIDMPLEPSQITEHKYNGLESLEDNLKTCRDVWGGQRVVNFLTLDYYNLGNSSIFRAVDKINGFV